MAQNITLLGASYSDVPSVLLPKTGGGTASFTDTSPTTASASDVAQGKIFFDSTGSQQTGTASGGGSSWTLVASTSYQVSTTSTTATSVAQWQTGASSIFTTDKIVYVRVRDTAGKRNSHFYGTDNFFLNSTLKNNPSTINTSNYIIRMTWGVNSSGAYIGRYGYTTTGYGVYANEFYSTGDIRIYSRYNSGYSYTIDGTYSVQVYLLDPPTGAPIFT